MQRTSLSIHYERQILNKLQKELLKYINFVPLKRSSDSLIFLSLATNYFSFRSMYKQRAVSLLSISITWACFKLAETNECLSNPCQNEATCNHGIDFYNCTCLAGYNGTACEMGK